MATKKIYLSPSMQVHNTYAFGGTNEMEQCNKIAVYAEKALKRCGFDVKRAPEGQDMYASIRESNNWGADLHVPIHTNAYNGKKTGGTVVFLYDNSKENVKAGQAVLDAVAPISPGGDYTLRYAPEFAELNSTRCAAVYLEVEFHDTKEGAEWIVKNVKNIGEAIAKGICAYYGAKYMPEVVETVSDNFETALLQALLRQAYAQGLCKTFVKPIDNKKGKLTKAAVIECRTSLGYKNPTDEVDLKFITELEHQINVVRIGKEDKLEKALEEEQSKLVGDFNEDGKVDIKDATAIQKAVAGIE